MWWLLLSAWFVCGSAWVSTDVGPGADDEQVYQMLGEKMPPEDFQDLQTRRRLIYPGTKWCGPGDVASGDDDLGPKVETDRCCRDHDNCSDYIRSGDNKHGLNNKSWFTKLSCECDHVFRRCLRAARTPASNAVGYMYFTFMHRKCFRKDYPIVGCKTRAGAFNRRCLEYELDETRDKLYQWFDVPLY